MSAVKREPLDLRWASDALQNNTAIVLTAVSGNGRAFSFASVELRGDRLFTLAAIAKSRGGCAFKWALRKLRHDANVASFAKKMERSLKGEDDEEVSKC